VETGVTGDARRWFAFSLLSVAFFMVNLDFSIVSIALPSIESELHVTAETAQWVLSGYALVFAGFLMLSGAFADRLGRRRFFLAGIALFGTASLIGGFANDGTTLIAMRALQGLGAAMCNPAGLAIAATLFSAGVERNRAVGYWANAGAIGVVFGMLLGGVLVAFFGWRSVLWVNVPLCAALLVFVPIFVPRDLPSAVRQKLDVAGAVTLTATLVLLTYTIVRTPQDGLAALVTLERIAGVIVLAALFFFVERRAVAPLVPRRVFAYQDFMPAIVFGMMQAAGYAGVALYASIYWQQVAALPALLTGFAFLPASILMAAVVGPTSAPLVQRFGARAVGSVGGLVMIAGMALALYVSSIPPAWWAMLLVTLVAFAGCMSTFEIGMIAALAHVDESDEGTASAAVSTMGQIGMGLGVAVAAALSLGRPVAQGVHIAFWSPFGFAVLTFLIVLLFIAGKRPVQHRGPPGAVDNSMA
jgi:MFS family permease